MTKIGTDSFSPAMFERYRSNNGPKGFSTHETNVRLSGEEFRNSELRSIDTTGLQSMRMSDMDADIYDSFVRHTRTLLELKHSSREIPSFASHPAFQEFAKVTVSGQTVATIDNLGQVVVYDATPDRPNSNKIHGNLYYPGEPNSNKAGPEWASELASRIALLVGGRVEKSETALSQSLFLTLPTIDLSLKVSIDHDAMMADPLQKLLDTMAAERAETEKNRSSDLLR